MRKTPKQIKKWQQELLTKQLQENWKSTKNMRKNSKTNKLAHFQILAGDFKP